MAPGLRDWLLLDAWLSRLTYGGVASPIRLFIKTLLFFVYVFVFVFVFVFIFIFLDYVLYKNKIEVQIFNPIKIKLL